MFTATGSGSLYQSLNADQMFVEAYHRTTRWICLDCESTNILVRSTGLLYTVCFPQVGGNGFLLVFPVWPSALATSTGYASTMWAATPLGRAVFMDLLYVTPGTSAYGWFWIARVSIAAHLSKGVVIN